MRESLRDNHPPPLGKVETCSCTTITVVQAYVALGVLPGVCATATAPVPPYSRPLERRSLPIWTFYVVSPHVGHAVVSLDANTAPLDFFSPPVRCTSTAEGLLRVF